MKWRNCIDWVAMPIAAHLVLSVIANHHPIAAGLPDAQLVAYGAAHILALCWCNGRFLGRF